MEIVGDPSLTFKFTAKYMKFSIEIWISHCVAWRLTLKTVTRVISRFLERFSTGKAPKSV